MKLTEKQKNCPYCHYDLPEPIYDDGFDSVICYSDGTIGMFFSADNRSCSNWSNPGTIHYCPMCGRPLNEKEE